MQRHRRAALPQKPTDSIISGTVTWLGAVLRKRARNVAEPIVHGAIKTAWHGCVPQASRLSALLVRAIRRSKTAGAYRSKAMLAPAAQRRQPGRVEPTAERTALRCDRPQGESCLYGERNGRHSHMPRQSAEAVRDRGGRGGRRRLGSFRDSNSPNVITHERPWY